MTGVEIGLFVFYGLVLFLLVVFGLHKYFLLFLYWKYKDKPVYKAEEVHNWPRVTVQLPIYNEKYVIRRLLEAVCAFDYPRVLLEIQVLDDSTDETQRVIESLVRKYRRQKVDITYIHRTHREGFKAGALANGMRVAKGEFLAIFDADFVPQPDFL